MRLLATFSLALLATLDAHAQGTLIWSVDNWAEHSGVPGESWEIAFDHVLDPRDYFDPWTPPSKHPATRIFFMTLATNDTGRTFFANALNEPGFAGFVAGLTDGANNYIRFQDGSPYAWRGQSEQLFLERASAAPDLAGYSIALIAFRVNNFYDWYWAPEERNYRTLEYSLDFYGAPVSVPILEIRRSTADVIISWPSSFTNFMLQQSTTVLATTSWSNFTGSVQDDGTNRTVTISPPAGNQFYRLFKP